MVAEEQIKSGGIVMLILVGIAGLLFLYLGYVLLNPEKF